MRESRQGGKEARRLARGSDLCLLGVKGGFSKKQEETEASLGRRRT